MTTLREAAQQALEALKNTSGNINPERGYVDELEDEITAATKALRAALEQPEQEPVSIKAVAEKHGINLPEQYIPTMDDAIAAGDGVLMNEQAALLRECRAALDSLIQQKPTLAGLLCGSTTLGNLKASLYDYRPQGVFGGVSPRREWRGLTEEEIDELSRTMVKGDRSVNWLARAIEAALKEKNR